LLQTITLAIALFASTNIDDLCVLVAFFADLKFRPTDVVTGQYFGIAILFALSLVGSLLSFVIPRPYIGLFGLVAVGVGVQKLLNLLRSGNSNSESSGLPDSTGRYTRSVTVALVTVANGSDNIAVYLPTFAVHSKYQIGIFAIIFGLLTGLWCYVAHWFVFHPVLGSLVRRYGRLVTPIVLIVIGTVILYDSGTFSLLFHVHR
jgi:cadmium resistance protein CadD (predicted permease)